MTLWKPPVALAGAACVTLSLCLFIPMLGTVHTIPHFVEESSVRIVAIPPEAKRELDESPVPAPEGAVVQAPTTSGAVMNLPNLSLASDVQVPALPGLSNLSLSLPSAPEPGMAAPVAPAFDKPPQVLTRLDPYYPVEARQSGTEGRVLIRVLIDEDGRVEEAEVVESQPAGVFDAAALKAIRGWRFSPAQRLGQPVAVRVDIPVSFKLD